MSRLTTAPVHLVGSFPAPDAETAFAKCCTTLKGQLGAVPDGETGWRNNFTFGLLIKNATEFPDLHKIWYEYDAKFDRPLPSEKLSDVEITQLKEKIQKASWRLGYVAEAITSYEKFCKLRSDGAIDKDVRFQVCLPGMTSFAILVKPEFREQVEDTTYQVLLGEVKEITKAIPAEDLALQFDVAAELAICEIQSNSKLLDTVRPEFHPIGKDAVERTTMFHSELINSVKDPKIEVGLHVCLGNINNQPTLEPQDMEMRVRVINSIVARAVREVQWVHIACLPQWTDPAPYEPLNRLNDKKIAVYLGIVYANDLEGSKKRKEAAKMVFPDFGIGTPCGMARNSEAGADSMLEILRELA